MKTEETYCVFLPNGLSGPEVVEIFVSERAANDSCEEIRKERKAKAMRGTSNMTTNKLKKHEKMIDDALSFSVTVITLNKAIEKIRSDAFDAGMWTDTPDESY